ncbi:MAG: TIGR04283 family arsenosugar biosynthesis glycosyltransferase [Acidobacteriota bacterium]|nr:MAG: TIGR04283 family arsenosugar biosynthesis glycosyltransferase [Acidobacteriota bacterium]
MKLTIIVPTLNEAGHLAASLASLPREAEVVVADGGSTDETISIATRFGARIVTGSRGRARQMNQGVDAACGDTLLFLHADCTLGPDAYHQLQTALADDVVVGGSFRMSIRDASWGLRWIAATSNARARYLTTPYGDQALFVRRGAFEKLGGFPEIPFMEDVALVRKLKRLGKLVRVDETVTTGARHWQQLGSVRTTLLNWSMVTLYLLGVPAERLEPYYRRWRTTRSTSKSENVQPQAF